MSAVSERADVRISVEEFRADLLAKYATPSFRSAFLPRQRKAAPVEVQAYRRGHRHGFAKGYVVGMVVGLALGVLLSLSVLALIRL